ncbi:MAG: hypothetical protein JOZ81_06090 [Chloroflexi bacterium]|nr:hypothetical protein [Chloroflexota bacterium]
MQANDPRADPTIVDLIELAGLWLAAEDWTAFDRTLQRLRDELRERFPSETEFAARFDELRAAAAGQDTEDLRRRYRRATVG